MSNQQPIGYYFRSALSSALVGGLANTSSGTAYTPADIGASKTAVSFADSPSYRPRRLRKVLQPTPTSLSLEPPTPPLDTIGHFNHAPSPGALGITARFTNATYPLTVPHVAPPRYTYQHQPPQCSFIPAGDSISILVRGMPPTQQPSMRLRLQPAVLSNVPQLLLQTNTPDPPAHLREISSGFNPRPLHLQPPPSNRTPLQKESANAPSPTVSAAVNAIRNEFSDNDSQDSSSK